MLEIPKELEFIIEEDKIYLKNYDKEERWINAEEKLGYFCNPKYSFFDPAIYTIALNKERIKKYKNINKWEFKRIRREQEKLKLEKEKRKFGNINAIQKASLITPLRDNDGFRIDINASLSNEQFLLASEKLKKYVDVFLQNPDKITLAKVPPQEIYLIDDEPVRKGNYNLAIREKKELIKKVKELEEYGVLSRQPSRYESPVFLKLKPDGSYRLLVDYRAINEKIIQDTNRVPKIDTIWYHFRNKKYFTMLDLNSGYFQISLSEKSKEITGVNIEGIGYVFNSIPQGLSISPSIF